MSALVAPVGAGGLLHEPLAHLPGISLGQLVEDAALLTRVDRKYLMPADAASSRGVSVDGLFIAL